MQTFTQIFEYLFQVLAGFYAVIALLRVLLQLSRADYYNPMSQFIVKATQPVVGPLRKVIPSWKNLDIAALIWCLIFQVLAIELAALVLLQTFINPLTALTWGAVGLLNLILDIFFFGLLALIIISFAIMLGGMHIRHPIVDLLQQLMSPVLRPFQKLLPPMGGLDLSPILVFLLINVLRIIVINLANAVHLGREAAKLVPGI